MQSYDGLSNETIRMQADLDAQNWNNAETEQQRQAWEQELNEHLAELERREGK